MPPKSEGREGEETEENNETHQIADPGGKLPPDLIQGGSKDTSKIADTGGDLPPTVVKNRHPERGSWNQITGVICFRGVVLVSRGTTPPIRHQPPS